MNQPPIHQPLADQFQHLFSHPASLSVSSPGRVNLIGEHTDYNDGWALPSPIPQHCTVLLAARGVVTTVRAFSVQMGHSLEYALGAETAGLGWVDHVQGITEELRRAGFQLGGFDALISSDVPLGSGLSSSACLLVAVAKGLRELFGFGLTDLEVAQLAQRAENGLVGARVGLMDQMACSLGRDGEALLIDFKTFDYRRVALPPEIELVILHSGITHSHAAVESGTRNYRTRRLECERACELLGVASLRDLTTADFERISALPAPLNGRAWHVVTENTRVLETVAALESRDLPCVGKLFYQSHESMRDDYDVSEPEIDLIVELARATPGIYGARLTGGGFGGSVVMLAARGLGRAAGETIATEYARRTGKIPRLLSPA